MSSKFEEKNDNINLVMEFEEEEELAKTTVQDAARTQWRRGAGDHGTEEEPILFEDLEEDEWLAILHGYIHSVIMGQAAEEQRFLFDEAAKLLAQAAIDERHGLGET